MKKGYYFCDMIDDSACFNYQKIVEFCKEYGINQITVFQAQRVTGDGTFYCDLYDECGYTSDSNCGRLCDGYKPLNGKNGRCKHSKYCYEKGAEVTFHNVLTYASKI